MARMIVFTVVVLPQPLSPMSPRMVPRTTSNEMSSTARMKSSPRRRKPRSTGKYFFRLRTCSRVFAHGGGTGMLWQVATWPAPIFTAGGWVTSQVPAIISSQRGWKGHPVGSR